MRITYQILRLRCGIMTCLTSGNFAPMRLLIFALPLLFIPPAWAAENAHPALTEIYYQREVIGYCGLTAHGLKEGFYKELTMLMSQHDLGETDKLPAQDQAYKDAYAEWNNRGLGGFRKWCQTEGFDAVERFSGIRLQTP